VDQLKLHPGFAAYWPLLRQALLPLTVIVDGAGLLAGGPDAGSDPAGAARRLRAALTELAGAGLPALPDGLGHPALARWYPDYVLVLDGDARAAAADPPDIPPDSGLPSWSAPLVVPTAEARAVAAAGSGADEIADLAGRGPGLRLVVTARPEAADRARAAGASVTGPQWLLGLL
jgi:8-oxo-dGTP diphosphatase